LLKPLCALFVLNYVCSSQIRSRTQDQIPKYLIKNNMTNKKKIEQKLNLIFNKYKNSFDNKILSKEKTTTDLIMKIFNKTQNDVDINKQYWNREFGKYFEYTVRSIFSLTRNDYKPGLRIKSDEVCDCIIGDLAIDVKYRVGSGDSGTLKKFRFYGNLLKEKGYNPVMLFLREDNLKAAITSINNGGWKIYENEKMFDFVKKNSEFDLKKYFKSLS